MLKAALPSPANGSNPVYPEIPKHVMGITSLMRKKIKNRLWLIGFRVYTRLLPIIESYEETRKNSVCYGSKPASSRISRKATIVMPTMLYLGENVHIGDGCYFDARGSITVGTNTHISRNVTVYSINHDIDSGIPYGPGDILKEVIIERNVWIGMNVDIAPGSHIKEGAVIAMGSVVSGVIPAHAIVASPKARVVKHRDLLQYRKNEARGRIGGVNGNLNVPRSELIHRNPIDFYVVGAGRSGTTTLSKLLSQNQEIDCRHESLKQLFQITNRLMHNQASEDETREKIKALLCDSEISRSIVPIKGESSQRLSPIIPLLSQITPEAKFISVIRKAEHAVSSMYSRGWFSDEELAMHHSNGKKHPTYWQITRVHADKMNIMTYEEWYSLGHFGRCCWYWNYWNSMIIANLECLDKQSLVILVESLNEDSVLYAQEFLGCTKSLIIKPTIHNQAVQDLYHPEDWSDDDNATFRRLCDARDRIMGSFNSDGFYITSSRRQKNA